MNEKERNTERFAVFTPIDAGVENGRGFVKLIGVGSDDEAVQQAAIELSDEFGVDSWSLQKIHPDGGAGKRKFFFSGATWKAPWQPTGPKSNWDKSDPSEPIN